MKKLFYALGAMMLLGLTAACVDPVNNVPNPNYDPIKDAVTTKFIINIASNSGSTQTKMPAGSVQASGNFRGMENATLFTFTAPHDGYKITQVDNDGSGNHVTATAYYPMTTIFGSDVILNDEHSNRVLTLTLPRETNTLVFYGQAITGTTSDEYNEFGGLQYTGLYRDMTRIGCNAMPRLASSGNDNEDFITIGNIILDVFNTLFKTGINQSTTPKGWENLVFTLSGSDTGQYDFTGKQLHWSDFSGIKSGEQKSAVAKLFGNNDTPATPLEQVLGITYDAMVHLNEVGAEPNKVKELRAGSGPALLRQARDLYTVVSSSLLSTPMDDNERVALCVFQEIKKYLEYFFVIDDDGAISAWKSLYNQGAEKGIITTIAQTLAINTSRQESDIHDSQNDPHKYSIAQYPFHFNLPMGAVTLVAGTEGNAYQYQRYDIDLSGMGTGTMTVNDYTYPPALVYYGNSPVRISESNDINDSSFPDGVVAWETPGSWNASWVEDSHVTINTRGVAMKNNVHYGNALLKTTVHFSSDAVNGGLIDNNNAVNGDPNKKIYLGGGTSSIGTDASKTLQLTGILIGGQPNHVGWCYLPMPWIDESEQSHTLAYNQMIYDKYMNGATATDDGSGVYIYPLDLPISTQTTTTNYTLAFDNFVQVTDPEDLEAEQEAQSNVYVALEFRNMLGTDFWGNANMIRDGGTFYLLGELKLTDALIAAFPWANASPIMPPYYTKDVIGTGTADNPEHKKGDTKHIVRVFMQDFTTEANFVIGQNALQAAYVTVPDLRTAKMSFGLSVDLNWSTGLKFNNIPLGK